MYFNSDRHTFFFFQGGTYFCSERGNHPIEREKLMIWRECVDSRSEERIDSGALMEGSALSRGKNTHPAVR